MHGAGLAEVRKSKPGECIRSRTTPPRNEDRVLQSCSLVDVVSA